MFYGLSGHIVFFFYYYQQTKQSGHATGTTAALTGPEKKSKFFLVTLWCGKIAKTYIIYHFLQTHFKVLFSLGGGRILTAMHTIAMHYNAMQCIDSFFL